MSRGLCWLIGACLSLIFLSAAAADEGAGVLVQQVVAAAGGEEQLLKLFRMRERLSVGADPNKPGSERHSIIDAPRAWYVGTRDRVSQDQEPAVFLVWAWTLRPLLDSQSKLELLPGITEGDRPAVGLRVSGAITPPMDLYFDAAEKRLVRIDWRNDIHRFSDWREFSGLKYPAKCVGYKVNTGKPWYFTEILELERLAELPAGLSQ
jgi:hypothetical protein